MGRGFHMGSDDADAALQMTSDTEALPDLCTPWRGDAHDLAHDQGWEFYRAFDQVLVEYLRAGDVRPFCDLVLNLKRQPGLEAAEYIAAMIDARMRSSFPEPNFPFEFGFKTKRGRPRMDNACLSAIQKKLSERQHLSDESFWRTIACELNFEDDPGVRRIELHIGLSRIERRLAPGRSFWLTLARALNFKGNPGFPLKAKLVRTADEKRGNRANPELLRRDKALAWFVDNKIAEGALRKCALKDVQDEIWQQGQWIDLETISAAHKRFGAKKRRPK